jgi:hypothetical protein
MRAVAQRRLAGLVNRGPMCQGVLHQPRSGGAAVNGGRSHVAGATTTGSGARCFHATSRAMAARRDLYEVLGASKDDSKSAIKKKYFKLAKKYHPDSNKGDDSAKEKFHEISAAYEVLSDDDKRSLYDATGQVGDEQQGFPGGGAGFNPNVRTQITCAFAPRAKTWTFTLALRDPVVSITSDGLIELF